ncbi:MAG: response regulator, partial [Gammaproteobacteria bacterium]|nr:response regulator [Gammaproteobacteria bacterium]
MSPVRSVTHVSGRTLSGYRRRGHHASNHRRIPVGGGATDVATARDASTGAVMLESGEKKIDCVICDHLMELLSGLDLLRLIRSGKLKDVPPDLCFVMVTGFSTTTVSAAAKVLDANAYLAKPITKDELFRAIQ